MRQGGDAMKTETEKETCYLKKMVYNITVWQVQSLYSKTADWTPGDGSMCPSKTKDIGQNNSLLLQWH